MRQNPASKFEVSVNATEGFTSWKGYKWGPNYLSNAIYRNHKRLFDNNETDLTKLAQMINLKQQPEEIKTFNIYPDTRKIFSQKTNTLKEK
jgi:hypothetical protein